MRIRIERAKGTIVTLIEERIIVDIEGMVIKTRNRIEITFRRNRKKRKRMD